MSALTVWQGLEERFRTIDDLPGGVLLGNPSSIQATPLLYAVYASAEQVLRSTAPARNLDGITHTFAVRIVFQHVDNPAAEMQLLTLADSVPSAINADPRLGDRLNGGVARSTEALTGFVKIGDVIYRVLEFTVTVLEKREAT